MSSMRALRPPTYRDEILCTLSQLQWCAFTVRLSGLPLRLEDPVAPLYVIFCATRKDGNGAYSQVW